MKEIGGYFGLEQLISHEYHADLISVNSARNGLVYLAKVRNIKKLYIPYFLCDSVANVCLREQIPFEYYYIDKDFLPIFDQELSQGEYLYIVNYYGQLDNQQLIILKQKYGSIIFDNVQAFFQKPVLGIDTIYSCRKFFGVPDGAYVSTDAPLSLSLEQDSSKDSMKHLLGRFEEGVASTYYTDFKANDHSFVKRELRGMSAIAHNILGAIDYTSAREIRERNFSVLHNALCGINGLKIKMPIGPYAYPFYVKDGMALKKQLAEKKIYVPTLWPNVLKLEDTLEKDFAKNILPLPVDQRYGAEEMEYMISEIIKCVTESVKV